MLNRRVARSQACLLRYTVGRRCQLYGTNRLKSMEHLSEQRIAEIREHGMRLSDFRIGLEFWMSGFRWRCTDVGSRLVVAIQLSHDHEPEWYSGPPYARHEGNSQCFTDDEVEAFRFSGSTETEIGFSDIPKITDLPPVWRRVKDHGGLHNYRRYRQEEIRKRLADRAAAERESTKPT
jgi:hypothetical protein